MANLQDITDGVILKAILKRKGLTQNELAEKLNIGRTRLNMYVGMPALPDELKEKIIAVLELPEDSFPKPEEVAVAQGDNVWARIMQEGFERLTRQNETLLYQQTQILKLLQESLA